MTALEQQLPAPDRKGLVNLPEQLVKTEHVAVVGPDGSVEGAERAPGDADVRVVDVAIDDVGYQPVRVPPGSDGVGQTAEQTDGGVDIQLQRLLAAESTTGQHLLRDRFDTHAGGDSKNRTSARFCTSRRS